MPFRLDRKINDKLGKEEENVFTWKNERIEIQTSGRPSPVLAGFVSRWRLSHSPGLVLVFRPHICEETRTPASVIGQARINRKASAR